MITAIKQTSWDRVTRFIISGGTGAAVNLGLLYLLTGIFGIWYIASAVVAFIISYAISFVLQKFWTFHEASRERMHIQASWYVLVALMNLGINTGLLYVFVDFAHIYYVLAQAMASVIIAIESYAIYRYIFRVPHDTMEGVRKGFTLIELLVVVGIIALMTALILPDIFSSKGKARDAQRVSDLSQIQLALELFYDRCGYYPASVSSGSQYTVSTATSCTTSSGTVTILTYMSQIPTPPAGASQAVYDYTVLENPSSEAVDYVLHAALESNNPAVAKGATSAVINAITVPNGDHWSPPITSSPYTNCSNSGSSVDYCIVPQ